MSCSGHEHRPPSQGCSLRRRNSRRHIGRCLPDRMGVQLISSGSRERTSRAGFCRANGPALLFLMNALLEEWAERKLHEAKSSNPRCRRQSDLTGFAPARRVISQKEVELSFPDCTGSSFVANPDTLGELIDGHVGLAAALEKSKDYADRLLAHVRFLDEVLVQIHELTDPSSKATAQDMQMIRFKSAVAIRQTQKSGLLT